MIGIFLVLIAFILLRFFCIYPNRVWDRLTIILFYSQLIIYFGLLIVGLLLCFLSDVKIGLITLGYFLFIYNVSVASPTASMEKRIPILGNSLTKLMGLILLIIGLILSFSTSLKNGFIYLGGILVSILILRVLVFLETERIYKKRLINH